MQAGEAQEKLAGGEQALRLLKANQESVCAAVVECQTDIEAYFGGLRQLLDEREAQVMKMARQRSEQLERQMRLVSKHVAEISAAVEGANSACGEQNLTLLHQKPTIMKVDLNEC